MLNVNNFFFFLFLEPVHIDGQSRTDVSSQIHRSEKYMF